MSGLYVGTDSARERSLRKGSLTLYGETVESADVMTPDRVRDYWRDEFRDRLRSDQDAVVLVWGKPGSGKSTCIIDLCRLIDPTFTPETLPERVAFKPADVPRLYKATPRYGAAWIDEGGSSGLLATDTHTPDQADLVELINIIRANNVALFVTIPDPSDLAKSFRARRADYRVETEPRIGGTMGHAHIGRRVYSRKFFLDDGKWLGFRDEAEADPYTWAEYRTSTDTRTRAYWDAYFPLKAAFMGRRIDEIADGMTEREGRRKARGA